MWKKVNKIGFLDLIKYKKTENTMISWETDDGIIHICSFNNIGEVQDNSPVINTQFTIWEKIKINESFSK